MRVARAAFLAGPALLLVAVLALAASFIADRRQNHRRRVVADDDLEAPAPAREWGAPARPAASAPPPAVADDPARRDTLRLRVDGPHGLRLRSVVVTMTPARDDGGGRDGGDDDDDDGAVTSELDAAPDGTFVVEDIEPGLYDVAVTADGLADAHLRSLASDAVGARVALSRLPVLIGAVGNAQNGTDGCDGLEIQVDVGDDDTRVEPVGEDCTFSVEGLARGQAVKLAVGDEDHEASIGVSMPAGGDPPPVCLGPPCASLPSALVVLVADSDGFLVDDASVSWQASTTDDGDSLAGGGATSGIAALDGLTPGARIELHASAGDRSVDAVTTVAFGITDLVVTLPAGPADD